jgi:hypothetical protein
LHICSGFFYGLAGGLRMKGPINRCNWSFYHRGRSAFAN